MKETGGGRQCLFRGSLVIVPTLSSSLIPRFSIEEGKGGGDGVNV